MARKAWGTGRVQNPTAAIEPSEAGERHVSGPPHQHAISGHRKLRTKQVGRGVDRVHDLTRLAFQPAVVSIQRIREKRIARNIKQHPAARWGVSAHGQVFPKKKWTA